MRIRVIGNCSAANGLRGKIALAGLAVGELLPDCIVELREGQDGRIVLDGVHSILETEILNGISIHTRSEVTIDRPGPNKDDRRIVITYPEEKAEYLELGILAGLIKISRANYTEVRPMDLETPWKAFIRAWKARRQVVKK